METGKGFAALVTGGAGLIGSHVATALLHRGWQVTVFDSLVLGSRAAVPDGAIFFHGDVRSSQELESALCSRRFHSVIHCAAQTSVPKSIVDPELDLDINVRGTQLVAEMARLSGVESLVFVSSASVYGETMFRVSESAQPAPRSPYAEHKLMAEDVIGRLPIRSAILRPTNVYGAGQRADSSGGVIAIFEKRLREGKPLTIHGSGHQIRDFVHVSDVVNAVLIGLGQHGTTVWNVSSGRGTTILRLARTIAQMMNVRLRQTFTERRKGDVSRCLVSSGTLLRSGLWGPPLSLTDGLYHLLTSVPGAGGP